MSNLLCITVRDMRPGLQNPIMSESEADEDFPRITETEYVDDDEIIGRKTLFDGTEEKAEVKDTLYRQAQRTSLLLIILPL